MTFEDDFNAWLRRSTNLPIPASVRAFSFHLYELRSEIRPFGIVLIGASDFDIEDCDWACDEVWAATPRMLEIPLAFSSHSWKACLAAVRRLVAEAVDDNIAGEVLKSREGVAVGFVDGDLHMVWHR